MFWLSPTLISDLAIANQDREWTLRETISEVQLILHVDRCDITGGDIQVDVTVDTAYIGCFVVLSNGDTGDFSASLPVTLGDGQHIGVAVSYGDTTAGNLRLEARLRCIGDPDEGPYVAETLTRRHETADGFTIETDGADLAVWPNEGSIGLSHDWVPIEGVPAPIVVTEDGQRTVRLDGNCGAVQRTVPGSGEFAAPVGAQFAPFWCLDVLKVGVSGAGTRWARTYAPNENAPGLSFDLDIPTTAAFQLVWQFLATLGNNIETVPNLDGSLLGAWALLEWGFDGTAFHFWINGAEVELTNLDPAAASAAAGQVTSYIGSRGLSDTIHIDYKAQFSYSVFPSAGQRAKTRSYLRATYPVIPPI